VAWGIAWPARLRTYSGSSSRSALGAAGVSPPSWMGNALAKALPRLFGRLLTGALAHAIAIAVAKPRGAYAPPLLFARLLAGGIATFAMYKSPHTRSGGREPAVCRADALAKALPQLLGRLSSVSWRTPLQSRLCNHGGLTPPALVHMRSYVAKVAFPLPVR